MTMIIDLPHAMSGARVFSRDAFLARFNAALHRHRANRQARTAARRLAEHNDAALADIGLTRADLSPMGVEDALDRQADALLRAYR